MKTTNQVFQLLEKNEQPKERSFRQRLNNAIISGASKVSGFVGKYGGAMSKGALTGLGLNLGAQVGLDAVGPDNPALDHISRTMFRRSPPYVNTGATREYLHRTFPRVFSPSKRQWYASQIDNPLVTAGLGAAAGVGVKMAGDAVGHLGRKLGLIK